MSPAVRFLWNGIRFDGKFYPAHYSRFVPANKTHEVIAVYARSLLKGLPPIGDVKNDSDGMTDYFETDKLYIREEEIHWAAVVEAMKKSEEHYARLRYRREAKLNKGGSL